MSSNGQDLLLFFDRPREPCFTQKGDENCVLLIPEHYYPDKYKSLSNQLTSKYSEGAGRMIPVKDIALPDLSLPMQLPYNDQFSLFVPKHRKMAGQLIDIFMNMRDVDDLMSICAYCQLRINPYMFNYCLTVVILHRKDTKGLQIPTFAEVFPEKFVDPKIFKTAREVSNVAPEGSRVPIIIPFNFTASDEEPEQKVAYFREDIGLNLHHWHWHLVYPFEASDIALVNKDRRGELLYYMHQQIIGRYNIERLCNNMNMVIPYSDFNAPIEEGYFPKLNSQLASRAWPPRFAGSIIRDLDRPLDQVRMDVYEMETWRTRIIQAIESQTILLPNNSTVALEEETGIDVLGNLLEATITSWNRAYYGDFHNMGHLFISFAHDPDYRHNELRGVMGDTATTMRDPVFYRWHKYIDDVFNLYKTKLPQYGNDRLDFPGICVSSINLDGCAGSNTIATHLEQSNMELSRGLDFTPRGSVLASFTHLQHEDFNYEIQVDNSSGSSVTGMFRIFMAPVRGEGGKPLTFEQQRRLMIEMDKFSQPLRPGNNTIRRRSADSSVTIPYERTFRSQAQRQGDPGTAEAAEFDFCGCGWPEHLLVPKGTVEGYPMVLFCMVSNFDEDKVEQELIGTCNDAASYCGIRDRKYPDRRAMGFPFDRPNSASSLRDFMTPNMAVQNCTIKHTNEIRQRPPQI